MKESFLSKTAADFRQRYQGSFGYILKDNGTKVLVKITTVDTKTVIFTDEDENEYFGYADKNVEFEFIPIQRKFVLMDNKACLFTRVPARQFTRGISEANTTYYTTNAQGNLVQKGFDDREVIKFIKHQGVLPYHSYMQQYLDGTLPFTTLSASFLVSKTKLWFFDREIGDVNRTKKLIDLKTPLVKQELSDAIRDVGFPYTLQVNV